MYPNKEVKVGLLVISALFIMYLGFNFLKGKEVFANKNTYYTICNHAKGLNTSSKIMLNGCPVGMVQDIELLTDTAHRVLIKMSINKNIQLTDKSIAKLVSNNLLGNKGIELLMQAGNPLHNQDTIQSETEQDFQAAFMENTLPTLTDAKSITLLTNQFMANLVDNTDRINSIFANLETAAQQMRKTITLNQKELSIISKYIVEISQVLADPAVGIRPLLTRINQLPNEVEKMGLGDLVFKINKTLDRIGDEALYTKFNQTLLSLDDLLVDFKASPNRYIHFSFFGIKPMTAHKRQIKQ